MLKKILTIFIFITLISLTSAVEWNIQDEVTANENFVINFYGSGLYVLEINIPNGFIIISDPSNGVIIDNIYRTVYATNLKLILRSPSIEGEYPITGEYSSGDGVKRLVNKKIKVIGKTTIKCPTCESDSEWSNCVNNKKVKTTYNCSNSTNYICETSTIMEECEKESLISDDLTKEGFFTKIKNFFKKIIDFIIFWN